jgi:predicted permease
MRALRELGRWLLALLKPARMKDEIDEELRFHIEMLAEEKQQAGLSAKDAWCAARRQFGNPLLLKERSWDAWGWTFWDRLAQDMRHTFRTAARSPMQTLLIVATLGLAMGGVLAIFSLLDKLIMRPLPVSKPGELALISAPQPGPRKLMFGGAEVEGKHVFATDLPFFKVLNDQIRVYQGMLAYSRARATMATSGVPAPANGFMVTGNYFDVLGVKAQFGRTLTPSDDLESEGAAAVVLTHGFWKRQFGGDPSVLHKAIVLNKQSMVVVGVTTPGFTGTESGYNADFFVSVNQANNFIPPFPGFRYDAPGYDVYTILARMAPGVDIQQAERETEMVYRRLIAKSIPKTPSHNADNHDAEAIYRVYLFPAGYVSAMPYDLIHNMKSPLKLLMAMVTLVLVVAVGNVANLLLARRAARARETAIRYALGSSRRRILRELLGESLLLSAGAAFLGYFLASWTLHVVPALYDHWPAGASAEPSPRSHLFAIGLAFVIGVGVWGASAVRATKRSLLPGLVENAAVGGTQRATHWRRGMVALQIAFSLILLCSSFVLCRSLVNLMSVDPGYSIDNIYGFSIDYGQSEYKGKREGMLVSRIAEHVRAIPVVRMVSMTYTLPLSGGANIRHVNDRPIPMDNKGTRAIIMAVGPDYFRALGIPLIAGREFTQQDLEAGRVAMVNEPLARILCRETNPIGRRFWVGLGRADLEIVGVVKEIKGISLRDQELPYLYLPVSEEPTMLGRISFIFRTTGPDITLNAVRIAVKQVDPSVQVVEFGSMAERVSQSIYRDRALTMFSLCFAGLASILCAIGVFGLTSYSIAGRTKEIGLRIALGANPGSIYRLVMKEIVWLSFIGCSVGLAGFITIKRIFTSLLFQLTPTDTASLVGAILVLGLTAFLAGFIPSRRAAKLDPSLSLRWE